MVKKSWLISMVMMLLITTLARAAEDLKMGSWRFELRSQHAIVPFIIELSMKKNRLHGKLYNGKETIPLENIIYSQKKLRIPLQTYEISLELTEENPERLVGFWVRHNKNPKVEIPVIGTFGGTERFPGPKAVSKIDLNGKWAIELTDEEGVKSQGVAVFEQKDNYFTGSVLTPTGDYRYMEGYVSGEEFQAASFDGMFNYLFKGKVENDKLKASILTTYETKIEGKKDTNADLPDAYKATQMEAPLKFTFPDLKDNKVSLTDKQFLNRPVIVTFFGTWCPNCIDEMNFLIPWYNANKSRGISVVALAFERSLSDSDAKRQLIKVQKKNSVPYPLLMAGSTSADKPMDKIQGLKNFISFPTTVFLNKKHEVVKIHAGFTGPSTGEFFEKWKKEFNQTVNELLK